MSNVDKILVVGHPGAGKGLFSQYLAKALNWHFINADLELEITIGKTIMGIIGAAGLASYLNTQKQIIQSLTEKSNIIVATDGAIFDDEKKLPELSLHEFFVVYLKTSTKVQLERTMRRTAFLAPEKTRENLFDELHQLRDRVYEQHANLVIDAEHADIELQVNFVVDAIQAKNGSNTDIRLTNKELTLFHKITHAAVALTSTQSTCLKFLVRGLSAKETAQSLDCSHRTVETHLSEIKKKLGCSDIKELIALYHHVV